MYMEKKKRKKEKFECDELNMIELEEIIGKWKKQYMSVIFLTLQFQDETQRGLRLLHYRYALVKKPDMVKDSKKQMKNFFGWKLKCMHDLNIVKKCITTTANLSSYLKKLVDLGALKKIPDMETKNLYTYRIDTECFKRIDLIFRRMRLIHQIKSGTEDLLCKLEGVAKEEIKKEYLSGLEQSDYTASMKKELKETAENIL